ncbi:MAG TPA: DUF2970 domain-containing protein [Gammaproteobacteria bacterium]|jgi:hypothetical protein
MPDNGKLTFSQVIKSILMSFFGVQKESIRERDFEQGKPLHFIVVGIILTICFILILVGMVRFVLYLAGV